MFRASRKARWTKASDVLRGWKFQHGVETDRMLILNQVWEREVGHLSRHWALAAVRRGILYVRVSTPAAAQELQLRGGQVVRSLNKYFKRSWIKGIRTTRE
ncbi:MAG: DUF721 domain-containing protein [Elusimicrobiota bacterium]